MIVLLQFDEDVEVPIELRPRDGEVCPTIPCDLLESAIAEACLDERVRAKLLHLIGRVVVG